MSPPRLEARGIVRRYGEAVVVDHVDLAADGGRVTVIIGPNGAGKTTLFNCLSGVETPDGGQVLLEGRDITRLTSDAHTRRGLARTFQHSSTFATMTVAENLRVGAENHRRGLLRGLVGRREPNGEAAHALVDDVMHELGLRPVADARAGRLPTGTLRLVELGRALCTHPTMLLLDEPTSGLDDGETGELQRVLRRLATGGLGLVLVEHDLDLVSRVADVVYAMVGGRIVARGSPEEVMSEPEVRTVVLGRER